jgi:EpsI family protein
MRNVQRWAPAAILAAGCLLMASVSAQRAMPLRAELSTLPTTLDGYVGRDQTIGAEEQRVAGMSNYVLRMFAPAGARLDSTRSGAGAFSVYVGYYAQQTQGRTIHSPKNCLPGAGWEALSAGYRDVATPAGPVRVNRYLLANKAHRALVYYWYQGRGRIQANEYRVKLELMRDAALRGRTEEALVRIVVPLGDDTARDADAEALADRVAEQIIPKVYRVLPA